MNSSDRKKAASLGLPDRCCTAQTGCEWDGSLRDVVTEPIYVQKVFDAALFNLQGLKTVSDQLFEPSPGSKVTIVRIEDIRCKKFFNPKNINDPQNLKIKPITSLSGAEFVKNEKGDIYTVVGPDGTRSERLIYADTEYCDEFEKGTPVYGTQNVEITGYIIVEIDVIYKECGGREKMMTLRSKVEIAPMKQPLILTNFFELCIPSVYESAFLPRFAEFCNISCEARLATNSIARDIDIDPFTCAVRVNLIISLCISCEKKILVPVQLCVLSTGYPELHAQISQICSTFPRLFPKQIDEEYDNCRKFRRTDAAEYNEEDIVEEDIET